MVMIAKTALLDTLEMIVLKGVSCHRMEGLAAIYVTAHFAITYLGVFYLQNLKNVQLDILDKTVLTDVPGLPMEVGAIKHVHVQHAIIYWDV